MGTGTRSAPGLGLDRDTDEAIVVFSGIDHRGARIAPCPFPPLTRRPGEDDARHVVRVTRLLERAMASGATHLAIPRATARWLSDHPRLADHLTTHHELLEANSATGIIFALCRAKPITFSVEIEGWRMVPARSISLRADRDLPRPMVRLTPLAPAHGLLRGHLSFSAERLSTLQVAFVLTRPDRRRAHHRTIYFSLERPEWLAHDLPFAEAAHGDGNVRLDFDLLLDRGRALASIEVTPVEEDNWRMHPMYPGGSSFALPDLAPAGARLTLSDLSLAPATTRRRNSQHGGRLGSLPACHRKPAGKPRDAVLFSSWVPEDGLELGGFFLRALQRWHRDSRIFVGINHGSSPRWRERLETSGLDVTIREAAPAQTMACDPTGFVAALDAYREDDDVFDLVWFGHTKGLGHIDEFWYSTGRWTIERMFWSRRQMIEQYFSDPRIGLFSPHYLMFLPVHHAQTDALRRMYHAPFSPLGAMAVSTHYVMRDRSLRDFCARVDPAFFRDGPAAFGGDMFFFEMAIPNVPIMQGYEPYIEPGRGGTSGLPEPGGTVSILNDWRQNNAVVAHAVRQWREDPRGFHSAHAEYREID